RCACRRGRISTRSISVKHEPLTPGASPGSPTNRDPSTPGSRPASVPADPRRKPGDRKGRMLADSAVVEEMPVWLEVNGEPPVTERLRALFKELFGRGERYNETGGIHAAALTDDERLLFHAEDIGRHNAVDKVVGAAVIAREPITGRGLLVTGRISAELAYKAARAGLAYVATPSVPSTLAVTIARRTGIVLVGRAVGGTPPVHRPD